MRLRNIKGADEVIEKSEFTFNEFKEHKGKWSEIFGNENPIQIEIGMGKGKFITQLALEHPEINYIGIERYSSVLLRAIEKRNEIEISNEDYKLLFDIKKYDTFLKRIIYDKIQENILKVELDSQKYILNNILLKDNSLIKLTVSSITNCSFIFSPGDPAKISKLFLTLLYEYFTGSTLVFCANS